MKILSLRVEQFRKFDRAVVVEGFGDGLNLIAGPNETGKSTLLLALRAALFERHSTKSEAVKDFSPHHVTGARPTVTLDFEIDGERFRLEKSFLKRPSARLETSSGRRFEGTEAETELKRLIGLNPSEKTPINKDSPAHFGVLLTPQACSFQQPGLAEGTRHTLEAAIAADIAELGNQSEVDGLLSEFDEMLDRIAYKRGEPKGRYKDVAERLVEIEREIAEAEDERNALRDQLERLEQALVGRSELQAAETREDLTERLTSFEAARSQAAHRQMLENRRLVAIQRLQAAETKRTARQTWLAERQRIVDEIEVIEKAAEGAKCRLGIIEETLSEREEKLADLDERRRSAVQRRRDLETLGQEAERLGQIERTLSALATDVRLDLAETALERVTLGGEPVTTTSEHRQVTEGLSIEIEGIGRIDIEPKIEPMREALSAKTEIEKQIGSLMTALDLANTGQEAVETAWRAIAGDIENLETARTEIEKARADERSQAAEANATLDASRDRQARLLQRLADIDAAKGGDADDRAVLDAEIADAGLALEAADRAFQAACQSNDPVIAPGETEIAALRQLIETQRRALDDANKTVVALESAIAVRSGLGLDEKIDQLDRQRHLLTKEHDAFALEHQALSLLQSTLRAAADKAKATFNAPLAKRLALYIQGLFPEATPVVTPNFSITALDRDGVEEPFLHLSDGTREQIAILARLAFADMLREQGLPVLIVLDDALAFSDDQRMERVLAIVEKAAKRMQIIILTCREDRFAGIKATRLPIVPVPGQSSSAA